ncbi:MAG: hypothetical protein LKJ05_02870 [Bifidobacteriaceae bacterium]|jgi:hypothetical protein|nr:hypothetical protein [Bifidobacteriaceae bacterium]
MIHDKSIKEFDNINSFLSTLSGPKSQIDIAFGFQDTDNSWKKLDSYRLIWIGDIENSKALGPLIAENIRTGIVYEIIEEASYPQVRAITDDWIDASDREAHD